MNECGENTPRIVSHYLDKLPLVAFSNMDIYCLLDSDINCQVGLLEAAAQARGEGPEVSLPLGGSAGSLGDLALVCISTDGLTMRPGVRAVPGVPALGPEGTTTAVKPGGTTALSGLAKWSHIVKRGKHHGSKPWAGTVTSGQGKKFGTSLVGTVLLVASKLSRPSWRVSLLPSSHRIWMRMLSLVVSVRNWAVLCFMQLDWSSERQKQLF